MRISRFFRCSAFLMVAMISVSAAVGQTVTGNIGGTITDSAGAVVAGANVIAHNITTSVDTPTVTNEAGNYSIRFLPIGQYEISVSSPGFQKAAYPAFALEIDQTANINVQLKVGNNSETVQVTASAPILNTNDASLGTVFTANSIENMPLNGLNFSAVTLYLPGAVSTAGTSGTSGGNAIERSTYFTDIPNINGGRAQANNYTLDGIDMNETQNNLIAYNPAPDALQELKVITADAPAEYGNVNGGDVINVLKSGTNRFHGSAYAFLQNENMNANSWGNDHAVPIVPKNPYTQSQFGGSIGGPIKHDKLFFFADYLGAREHTGGTGFYSVFTPAMRTGDFSILLAPPAGPGGVQNAPIQLYDTQNNFKAYANNQIQILNPVATYLFAHPELYPLPNATPLDGVAQNNYQGPSRSFIVNNQGDIKIEYDPRVADKLTGFYSQSDAYDGNVAVLGITFPPQNRFPTKLGGATWVHVFGPRIVNSARVGFTRVFWLQSEPTDPTGVFGLTGNAKVGIPFGAQSFPGYSYQGINNGIGAGGTTAQDGSIIDNTYTYTDNLTWQHGVHLLSMGVQAIRYQNNYITSNNFGFLGSFSYSGNFTSDPNADAVNGGGYGPADFVLDRVSSANVTEQGVLVGQRQWRTAGFVQDDWKVMPNLTLNLGLRYEYDQPWYEVNNKTGNVLLDSGTVEYAGRIPAGAPAGSILCGNRACYKPNYTQFMPRVGFAWQARPRLVVRAGYGATSFFEGNAGNQRLTSIPPFIQASQINAIAPTASAGSTPASGGSPLTIEEGFSSNPNNINYAGQGFSAWPQDMRPAYVQEWSLTTEYALTNSTSLQVGYLGEQGQHLIDYGNANQLKVPGDFTTAPFANLVGSGGALLITESRAMMNFNALESTLRQRASHGLEFTVNYTYGRAMTNSLGNYGLLVNGFSGAFQNYYNSQADYGPAGYDVRHNLSGTMVYALPVGRGQQFGSGVNRILDEAIGGWKVSSAVVAYSGFPETITGPGVSNSNSFGQARANQYRKMNIVHRSLANWFGTDPSATPCTAQGDNNGACAYGSAAPNTFGTTAVGSERGPGFMNVDASAFKDFHITEKHSVGFRADAFNALNIASYTNPSTSVTDPNFGQAEGTRSTARQLQLSLHYNF